MTTYQPEKLSVWDRLFNRYKRIPIKEDKETWEKRAINYYGAIFVDYEYVRYYIVYHNIDRLTGGYEIIKEYLN